MQQKARPEKYCTTLQCEKEKKHLNHFISGEISAIFTEEEEEEKKTFSSPLARRSSVK